MRALRPALLAAVLLTPGLGLAQTPASGLPTGANPPAPGAHPSSDVGGGAASVQAPVPEVGNGRGSGNAPGTANAPVPPTAQPAPATPAQSPAAPQPVRPPTPVAPITAPQPFGDRGQQDAAELEAMAALRGERIEGRVSIPNQTAASLIQPEGRDWRRFHNVTLSWIGAVAVLGMVALLGVFFLVKGRIRVREGFSGRTMRRFNWLERTNHWMTAGSFIVLALSGLNLTFGRHLLLPLIGPEAFTAVTMAGKLAHNFLAFPFTLGLVVMLLLWVRDNIPNRVDLAWLKAGGGFIGHGDPPAGRFNAGQKAVFWITVGGGALVAASGYMLIFPFFLADIAGMQLSHIVHGSLAMLMVAAMLAHIYIGTLGMEGAFSAMSTGRVDYNWAREHHRLWVEEELTKAHETVRPGGGATRPAGAD